MPSPANREENASLAREVHGFHHVGRARAPDDQCGTPVDQPVLNSTRVLVFGLTRVECAAAQPTSKVLYCRGIQRSVHLIRSVCHRPVSCVQRFEVTNFTRRPCNGVNCQSEGLQLLGAPARGRVGVVSAFRRTRRHSGSSRIRRTKQRANRRTGFPTSQLPSSRLEDCGNRRAVRRAGPDMMEADDARRIDQNVATELSRVASGIFRQPAARELLHVRDPRPRSPDVPHVSPVHAVAAVQRAIVIDQNGERDLEFRQGTRARTEWSRTSRPRPVSPTPVARVPPAATAADACGREVSQGVGETPAAASGPDSHRDGAYAHWRPGARTERRADPSSVAVGCAPRFSPPSASSTAREDILAHRTGL